MGNNKFKGKLLREKRRALGLTQLELASRVNDKNRTHIVDAKTISGWEINPNAVPRNNKLVKVAEVLGCMVEELFELSNSSSYKLLSLNVNNFCGTEKYEDYINNIKDVSKKYFPDVIEFIKKFLKTNMNGVVFLQEVPKVIYNDFLKVFSGYSVIEPVYMRGTEFIRTIAITNRESGWEKIEESESIFVNDRDYANRIVEIQNGKVKVMGVQMYLEVEDKGDSDVLLWEKMLQHIEKYTVVIGDFNAHTNSHRDSKFRNMLNRIEEKGYMDLISSDFVTFYPAMTTIDHTFVSKDVDKEICKCEVIPKNFSDHAVICVDIVLKRD